MRVTPTIAWTIAGSDSGGGAGIQADLHTFQQLGVHGCSVIAAVTAQNSKKVDDIHIVPGDHVANQIQSLMGDLPAVALKLGMLGHAKNIEVIAQNLKNFTGKIVLDPVMIATSGDRLFTTEIKDYLSALKRFYPYVDILTPNIPEAETILGRKITSQDDIPLAAQDILNLGVKSILIKGGHDSQDQFSQDFWTDGKESFWLVSTRLPNQYHGSGCTLSAAITASLALGYDIKDALVIAKMYVNQGMRATEKKGSGPAAVAHLGWPENEMDLPSLSLNPWNSLPKSFPDCGKTQLGLYPIVDDVSWLEILLPQGVNTIQLRIKNKTGNELETAIKNSIELASKFQARLFINDYWELAIQYGAYGVHLGQEDLLTANIDKIRQAGLRLGISTHCYYEVARAHTYRPSYLACGPIFPTTSKQMPFLPQGVVRLKRWRRTLNYPLVAIGGINLENIADVMSAKIDGVAMISAITQSTDANIVEKLLASFSNI